MTSSELTTRPEADGRASAVELTTPPERFVDATQRRAEIVIASLFLVTALASIPAAFLLDPILNAPDFLARILPDKGAFELGALMWSINNIGIVFIAVFAFPLLRRLDEALAVGYLACRIVEGTIMMVGIVATFLLIPLSQQYLETGPSQSSSLVAIGEVLKHARFLGLSQVSLPLLGLGGLIFTWLLFRFRLVPPLISVIGLIGYALVFAGGLSGWFDLIDVSPGGNGSPLAVPVALFEIILLPFWLFYRGFNMPEDRQPGVQKSS